MKAARRHLLLHAVAAAALLTGLILLPRYLQPQIPVDLRLPPASAPVPRGAARIPDPPADRYDFMACRLVIEDLLAESQTLEGEARNLLNDGDSLWRAWKGQFGVRGSWLDWGLAVARSTAAADEFQADRMQARIFRLVGDSGETAQEAEEVWEEARADAQSWASAGGLPAAASLAARGRSGVSREEAVLELKEVLARTAARIEALDARIRAGQRELDEVYLRARLLMQQHLERPPVLTRPWHWAYMLSDRPRPSLRRDFRSRYAEALSRARQAL